MGAGSRGEQPGRQRHHVPHSAQFKSLFGVSLMIALSPGIAAWIAVSTQHEQAQDP